MPSTAQDWVELSEQWSETFGEELVRGSDIGDEQIPLLGKCIAQKSQKPLEDYIERELAKGRVY